MAKEKTIQSSQLDLADSKAVSLHPPQSQEAVSLQDLLANPAQWLVAKGWLPQGDPRLPSCRWLDPAKPVKEMQEEVAIMERKTPSGAKEVVKQLHITPPAWPMTIDDAIATQTLRDAAG